MAGMFDDLVPAAPASGAATAPAQGGMFDDLVPQQGTAASPAAAPSAAPAAPQQTYEPFSVLPLREDAQGIHFDSDAGILGAIKRPFVMAGDVATGKLDPSSQEGIQAATQAAMIFGPGSAALGGGALRGTPVMTSGMRAANPADVAAPTAQALKDAAGAGYDAARGMGVDYHAGAVSNVAAGVKQNLEQDGILAELAPKTHAILDKFANPPDGAVVPFGGLEAARRALGFAQRDFTNPTEQLAARRAVDGLDDFLAQGHPSTVAAGSPDAVASIAESVTDARANYAAAKRIDQLQGVADAADLRASAANSGQNIGNSIRSRAASLLLNPKALAGFSDDEVGQIQAIARGTPLQNTTRYVGNMLGGGGGIGALATGAIGHHFAGPAGFAAPALGIAAKKASNAMTQSALDQLIAGTGKRSPLYGSMLSSASVPTSSLDTAALADQSQPILLRMMLANGVPAQPAYQPSP